MIASDLRIDIGAMTSISIAAYICTNRSLDKQLEILAR